MIGAAVEPASDRDGLDARDQTPPSESRTARGADVAITRIAHLDRLVEPSIATVVLVGWTNVLAILATRGVVERDV